MLCLAQLYYDAIYKNIDFEIDVYYYSNYDSNLIKNNVNSVITEFFAYDSEYIDYGSTSVNMSDIYTLLNDIDGISYVTITSPTTIDLNEGEYPILNTLKTNMIGVD